MESGGGENIADFCGWSKKEGGGGYRNSRGTRNRVCGGICQCKTSFAFLWRRQITNYLVPWLPGAISSLPPPFLSVSFLMLWRGESICRGNINYPQTFLLSPLCTPARNRRSLSSFLRSGGNEGRSSKLPFLFFSAANSTPFFLGENYVLQRRRKFL